MREILFRGKRRDNGEWIEGFYHYTNYINPTTREVIETAHYILPIGCQDAYRVIPETVGQYTGLTDKNGKKIFEDDILNNEWCFACGNSVVKFGTYKTLDMAGKYQQGHLGFHLEHTHEADKRYMRMDLMFFANKGEIVGNIHDNPEFLEVTK